MNQTTTALEEVTSELQNVISQLNILKGNTGLQDTAKQADNLRKSLNGTTKLSKLGNAFKSTIKLGVVFASLRKGFNIIKDITMQSVDMIETTNLFEVSMGKVVDEYGNLDEAQSQYYTRAMAFQDEMNQKLGTNKKELMEFQAKFNALYANQGVDKRTSEWLSEQLSKAGHDIASLRNQDVSVVMDKLYSGITGQTKSIRDLGVDISEGSITATLQNLGINRTVNQLSYAEKEIARYLTIVEQAKSAQGDFARTFETPANQIKVFKNQLIELKQVAGPFFVGLFGKIMPYINGIIMAIKEVLKALGAVFGFNIDVEGSSLGAVDDTVGDIETGLGGATAKAKEFKKQLMGFDEINNIEPPSSSSGGSGGGVPTGVDSALLNSLKEWDNMMDSISGKAQEIRDKILDWLGVTDGSYENLKRIWEMVKTIGIAFATWKVSSTITTLLEKLGVLNKTKGFKIALGITLAVTGFENWISGANNGDLIQSILGALTTGGGVWLATGSLTIALPVTLTLSLVSITKKIDDKIKLDEKIWKPLYEKFGFEYTGNDFSFANWWIRVQIVLDFINIIIKKVDEMRNNLTIKLGELGAEAFKKATPNWLLGAQNMVLAITSKILEKLSEFVSKIPIIGEKLSGTIDKINEGIKKNVIQTTNDITNQTETAMEKQNNITETSLKDRENIFNEADVTRLSKMIDNFNKQNSTIESLSPAQIRLWQQLAETSEKLYNEKISQVDEDTRLLLDAINDKIDVNSPEFQKKWEKMSEESRKKFNEKLNGIDKDTSTKIQSAINEINNKKQPTQKSAEELANVVEKGVNTIDTTEAGKQAVAGVAKGINQNKNSWSLKNAISGVVSNVTGWFKKMLGINSPSKVFADLASYIPEGITKGINDNIDETTKPIKKLTSNITKAFSSDINIPNIINELNQGIKINPTDFAINANQYVDYGAIKGKVLAQSQISISGEIRQAVIDGMRNAKIAVEVEGKADKDGIFKIVQTGAREYTMQTGEPAFEF